MILFGAPIDLAADMLSGDQALDALASLVEEPENSRSSYWDLQLEKFQISQDHALIGSTVLGNVSGKRDPLRKAALWVLQTPLRIMGRKYRHFKELAALGRVIADKQERLYTEDILRQVLSLAAIRDHPTWENDRDLSVVIGDGLGVMATLVLMSRPGGKVILVNLTKPLIADLVFLRKVLPDRQIAWAASPLDMDQALGDNAIDVIAVRADDAGLLRQAPVGLAINITSMQEMNSDVTEEYFDILRNCKGARTSFYCCNKLSKTMPDGTETRFRDYPWRQGDEIMVDEACKWFNVVSNTSPPFWIIKKFVTWHRFSVLEKDRK